MDLAEAYQILASDIEKIAPAFSLPHEWKPRSYQESIWKYLEGGGKRACLIWHRRSGKDDVALNWAAKAAHLRLGEYWHMLPEASQARKAIWDAVSPHTGKRRINQAFPAELVESRNDQEMKIRFKNGSLWRVVGSDNYDSLLGSTPAGIVYSEWALADPNARAFLRPILAENKGWELFITTPRGTANHAKETYEEFKEDQLAGRDAFAQILTANDTNVFTQEELDKELKGYQKQYGIEEGQALFDQEYGCSFTSALVGSFYGAYLNKAMKDGRIVETIPIDRSLLVHTGWDLGRYDSTAIWFIQVAGLQFRFIDYYEANGIGLDEYAAILNERRDKYKWVYGIHYFPHDMNIHEWGNKYSRIETAKQLGFTPKVMPQHSDLDGVNAVRRILDMAWIDRTRCARGLEALSNFRREYDERLKIFREKYLHDWSSHGAKALESFAIGYKTPKERKQQIITLPGTKINLPQERGTGWMGQ